MTASPVLSVDVVSDVVCPWCYVGKRRLEAAAALVPDQALSIRWRPFQLDPTIPEGGLDRREYMLRKFGSAEKLAEIHGRLTGVGADVGIPFAFASIARSPNTLDAHRLIRWAHGERQGALVEALFRAFFVEGRDIGDRVVLAQVAGEAGFDAAAAAAFLASGEAGDLVVEEIEVARRLGIQGVPFFIFGGKYAVSGAEAPETLARAIGQAAADPQPATA